MKQDYPFEIAEVNPAYLTDLDLLARIEQLRIQLLAILKDDE